MAKIRSLILDGLSENPKRPRHTGLTVDVNHTGIYGDPLIEAVPTYNRSSSEKVHSGKNNTFIVFGRDRPRDLSSGNGGQPISHCGCIDIIAGMSGILTREANSSGEQVVTDKSPEFDAARIYISQRAKDIDSTEYFGIAEGKVGFSPQRSAIAIKADAVRIIGREGIKIVTGTDTRNSLGLKIDDLIFGIDLIAGNNDQDLQPLVKGKNLQIALMQNLDLISDINAVITKLCEIKLQETLPIAAAAVASGVPSSAPATLANLTLLIGDLQANQKNLWSHGKNFLSPIGDGYINSKINNTN
mgnify:CR=1 FL=1